MKLRTRAALQFALWFVLGGSGFAADQASLYVVHGIPGRALPDSVSPTLPIDVLVNGESCLVQGLTFTNTTGPFALSPGRYDLQISPSNRQAPCTNPPLIDSQVTLTSGASVSVVATLSGGQPALLDFTDNLIMVAPGNARCIFAQSADAAALQVTLTQMYAKNPATFTLTPDRGAQQTASVPAGTYLMQVLAVGSTDVLTSQQIALLDQYATFTYATGEAANNSLLLVNRVIRDGFQPGSQPPPSSGGSF